VLLWLLNRTGSIIRSGLRRCQCFARSFALLHVITERVAPRLSLLLAVLLLPCALAASDARAAVEAFLARLAGATISDLVIEQAFTLYHPDGRHRQSTGEQRVWLKVPRRQRLEQVMEGRREVRLSTEGRVWIRTADGRVYEAPPQEAERDRTHLVMPFRRSAADLLAEWRALGVRDDVSHLMLLAGRPVAVIGARPGERDTPAVWLDAELGVVRFIRRERLPRGEGLVDLAFSEHRPLTGGFAFPHRQEAFVDGKLLLLIVVRSVAVNADPPDALFDPEALRRDR
jgi:outer membrane lipoprotein-sorting protein